MGLHSGGFGANRGVLLAREPLNMRVNPLMRTSTPRCVPARRCLRAGQSGERAGERGRGRDPAHERAPGPGILTPSRVPAQHAIGCLGDEDHGVWAQVDAVDEDDLMHLIDDRAERS